MKIVVVSAGLGQPSSTQMLGERLGQATGADEVIVVPQGPDLGVKVGTLEALAR